MENEDYIISADRNSINIHENYQVEYWTNKLGISRENLQKAVAAVGTYVDDVREYLLK